MSNDEKLDRVRRRLLKQAAYVPPLILSLAAQRAQAGRAAPTAAVTAKVQAQIQAKIQAKIGGGG